MAVPRIRRGKEAWLKKNNFTIQGEDDSLSGWFHHFVELVGEKVATRLTVELRRNAYKEAKAMAYRMNVLNETIPFYFEWDKPGDPLVIL